MEETDGRGKFWNDESGAAEGFPVVRRGYDVGRVDEYVAASQAQLTRLHDEAQQLRATVTNLEKRLAASSRTAAHPLDAWGMNVDKLLDGARADLDKLQAASAAHAQQLNDAAQADAEKIVATANDTAARVEEGSTKRHEQARRDAVAERQLADRAISSARGQLAQLLSMVDDVNARWTSEVH
jgi:cell division septum initiation protein DivIVA